MSMKIKKLDKWFLLSWKKTAIALIIWIGAVFFHNLVSALINIEEPVFFIVSVIVIPIYFIISIIYSIFKRTRKDI